MNLAIVIGNLGADPDLRYTKDKDGTAVANFNIATTEKWKNKDGEKQESTEWHRIVAWDKQAEVCAEYLSKGDKVCVRGTIKTRKWTDDNDVERYTTEIHASQVEFLNTKGKDDSDNAKGKEDSKEAKRGNRRRD